MRSILNCSLLGLLAGLLVAGPVTAGTGQPPVQPQASLHAHQDSIRVRAERVTGYLTYALRLTARQQRAVRQCLYQELQQLDSLGQEPVALATRSEEARRQQLQQDALRIVTRYETAMGQILSPGQYSTFSWLQERQPVADR